MPHDREGLLALLAVVAPGFGRRALLGAVAGLGLAVVALAAPFSPLALCEGDLLAGLGRAPDAAAVYDAVARWSPWDAIRRAALERSADTWSLELGSAHLARLRLEELLRLPAPPDEQAAVLERVGTLLLAEGREDEGVRRLREAHDLAPEAPGAAHRLELAATAAGHAGHLQQAEKLWRKLGEDHPDRVAVADLGCADIALRQGRIQSALDAYGSVTDHTFDPDLAAAAKLGSSICLERLGDLEEALAELDEADLPPGVFEQRSTRMKDRLPTPLSVH